MDARTVEQITDWDSRPFSGGFNALRDLADADFSGAVKASGAWLFMLNGRGVGVFDGEITDFGDTDGTIFEAPHPSLPLLLSMQERGGKTQAKYYTNDTPLAEASDTLASKNFTGYVELSENVLSGDYYVVYHAGRSMTAAYVGESEKLLTGDEAFERANDEVGIYEVVAADVDIIDIPEPQSSAESEPEPTRTPTGGAGQSSDPTTETSETAPTADQSTAEDRQTPPPVTDEGETARPSQPATRSQPVQSSNMSQSPPSDTESKPDQRPAGETKEAPATFSDEQQWRETTTIPSLDPEKSSASKSRESGVKQRRSARNPSQRQGRSRGRTASNQTTELETELVARTEQLEALQTKLKSTEVERDELEKERDRLQNELDELRTELESVRQNSPGVAAERQITPQQAFSETNLFVRYGSKGKGTLADAAAGEADRGAVESNLKLEHHTQFDVEGITVDGKEYETFLHESMEYQFVSWLVVDLLYEIVDTDHQRGLKDLFDAIQEIDRAELHGVLAAENEDGEEREMRFDVILRDRMGNPLIVANINDSRDPATGEMLGSLVDASSDVATANNELSAAFQVTRSFFEPAALETTEDATSGGLLTREKRESFVKLSRKRGYHLCLVESRNGEFHLTVPEL
ncbi:DUF7527 domain-containing protein [Haladaptatus caseinilyticus]|uniref:DUF7527 domain-containing protein n=1 Tax=Haladaptatus caseinilyticus TaxID=2993314 RepID=UPI00224B129E|nr:hypothetical protein [Haladaptatus caseinilyticus]